ncbi:MAG TPA: bifunctional riboflavin kinase/FMN adenylyltransferase [Candidatus Binatia bacterium]|nr:bifunctional riboflavin kinase/FMN adenylyltransferase [Candidatus Binatia bacterium]
MTHALDELPPVGPAALTLGVFDGVHRGHAALLEATVRVAAERGVASAALIFEPHPDEVLRPGTVVPRLTPLATVVERIRADCGVAWPLPVRFDDELRQRSAEEFIAALAPAVELRALVMTPDAAFGRGRGGTVARMRELGAERGFEVVTVEPVLIGGEVVSSTRTRSAIAAGEIGLARTFGYPPRLEGTVVVGDRRGRTLGYPTANLAFDYAPAMPALGIYVGQVAVPERGVDPGHPALVSVGVRPTFHDDGRVLVEVHLLDFDGDLYGARLQVDLLERLREERRFEDADSLVRQMKLDEAAARGYLGIG